MMLRQRIELPAAQRRVGGLLADGRPLDAIESDWWSGVVFSGHSCAPPALRGPCANEFTSDGQDQVDGGDRPSGPWSFAPVTVRAIVECTALSMLDAGPIATARLDYVREWALGRTVQTGDHTDHDTTDGTATNPALVDGTSVGTGLSPVDAVAALDAAGADRLYGAPVTVHMPPQVAAHALANDAIWRDGTRWRTAAGSLVVVSPGYQGIDMYATGEIFTAAGMRTPPNVWIDRTNNDATTWADELVIGVFDACWIGKATTDLDPVDTGN